MRFERSCGCLVHPTSFPAPYGIGDFGEVAKTFLDFLVESEQSVWQVLPLGPTGYGNSPYASYSAFAGNPYLLSPDILAEKGLVSHQDIESIQRQLSTKAEYEIAYENKSKLLKKACRCFYSGMNNSQAQALEDFKRKNAFWIYDYALFMACLKQFDFKPWNQWDAGIARRRSSVIDDYRTRFEEEIKYQYWVQYEFFQQWHELKDYANQRDIKVIGDIPIFVDHNSADVWAHPEYFEVDKQGNRKLVAGVPPDYFSETGQLWGNPVYKWDKLEKEGYEWWIKRFDQMFHMYDAIRVDHFRGFEASWQVPASENTAEKGEWIKGPGAKLFETIKNKLGSLPIIAEDLGFITPEVVALRDQFKFPGMKILQFAFDSDSTNSFLPHNYHPNSLVYTGTHDNDTTIGWYYSAPEIERHRAREYTKSDGSEINWELIRLGMLSVADIAIFPLQDYMNLGTEHRMNLPGKADGNWQWRYTPEMLDNVDGERIRHLVNLSNRNVRSR